MRVYKTSNGNACSHHFAVEHGVFLVFHQYRLNQDADLADIADNVRPLLPRIGDFRLGHDDGHVDVAVGRGIALGIRTVHHDLRLRLVARTNHLLVASDDADGLVAAESFSSIHCVSSLVSLIMCWQIPLPSIRATSSFFSG